MKKTVISLLVVAALLASCTTRLIDFTVLSSKNVDLSKAGTFERGKSRVEGKDVTYLILFIPTGIPNMKEAIDRALEKVPGAVALVDGVVSSKFIYFLVGGMNAYIVEGTPLIDPALAQGVELESNYMYCRIDKNGEVKSFEYVDEAEYNALKAQLMD